MISRVLKAKYYSRGDFFSASLRHNPSYTWHSICSAQDLVMRKIGWRLGGGSDVRLWNDSWLNDDDSFYLGTPRFDGGTDLVVGTRLFWGLE